MEDRTTSEQGNAPIHQGAILDLPTITLHQPHPNNKIAQAAATGMIETVLNWPMVAGMKRTRLTLVSDRMAVTGKELKRGQRTWKDAHVTRTIDTRTIVNNLRLLGTTKAKTMQKILITKEGTTSRTTDRAISAARLVQIHSVYCPSPDAWARLPLKDRSLATLALWTTLRN